jgi:hypothetical protein
MVITTVEKRDHNHLYVCEMEGDFTDSKVTRMKGASGITFA